MFYFLTAACMCHKGKVRSNNEDNFLFDNKFLPEQNHALAEPISWSGSTLSPRFFCVFDGMGGEACGESASFAATTAVRIAQTKLNPRRNSTEAFLEQLSQDCNQAVFQRSQELLAPHAGSTMAMMCFTGNQTVSCNLGDSRVFRFRDSTLEQLSLDHTDEKLLKERGIKRKPRLTQHLGIDPAELTVEPYILSQPVKRKDVYLICSDGITDMIPPEQIVEILKSNKDATKCVAALVETALENGGKDNATAIVCQVL